MDVTVHTCCDIGNPAPAFFGGNAFRPPSQLAGALIVDVCTFVAGTVGAPAGPHRR